MRTFHTLLKLRRLAEEKTATSLASARRRLAEGKQQGSELASLAGEYADQHAASPPDSASRLKQFRLFYAELHAAVSQQLQSSSCTRQNLGPTHKHTVDVECKPVGRGRGSPDGASHSHAETGASRSGPEPT